MLLQRWYRELRRHTRRQENSLGPCGGVTEGFPQRRIRWPLQFHCPASHPSSIISVMKLSCNYIPTFQAASLAGSVRCKPEVTTRLEEAVFAFQDCRSKVPPTGWLTKQNFILSQFWRLEVQNQGVSRVGSF